MFGPNTHQGESKEVDGEHANKGDYLLEVLELAMNRDPDQDFELWLVLETEKEDAQAK